MEPVHLEQGCDAKDAEICEPGKNCQWQTHVAIHRAEGKIAENLLFTGLLTDGFIQLGKTDGGRFSQAADGGFAAAGGGPGVAQDVAIAARAVGYWLFSGRRESLCGSSARYAPVHSDIMYPGKRVGQNREGVLRS